MKALCFGLFGAAAALAGCSDGSSYSAVIDAGQDSGATTDTKLPSASEAGGGDETTSAQGTDASVQSLEAGALGLVINEISGKGNDYVEIFNAGATAIDLAGWGVTEAKDDDAGVAGNNKTPALFPAGSSLAPNAYAMALGAPKDGGVTIGPCPASVCVQAIWNVSNSSGATVYLLDPANAKVALEAFPKETVGSGQSWGRLPNGTGTFAVNTETPGAANKGPGSETN